MTVGGLLGALKRRWYIVVVGALLTAAGAFLVYVVNPPQYTARALVLLLPSLPADEPGGNPFLSLGGLDVPARVLVATYSSTTTQEGLAERAPDAEVVVTIEEATRGPVIAVDVEDSTAQTTLETLNYVVDSIPETLAELQAEVGVPVDAVVRSMPLTVDTQAEISLETAIRLLIAVAVVGLAATVAVAYALDGLLRRRARRSSLDSGDFTFQTEREDDFLVSRRTGPEILRQNVPASPRPAQRTRADVRANGQ